MEEESGEYFRTKTEAFDVSTAEGIGAYLRYLRTHAPLSLIETCRQDAQARNKKLRQRTQKALTQELLATYIRSSQRWYAKLEAGQISRPDPRRIAAIAEVYGLDYDMLVNGLKRAALVGRPKGGYCPSPSCPDIDLVQLFLTGKFILAPAYYRLGKSVSRYCSTCGETLVIRCPSCQKALGHERQRFCGHCGAFLYRQLMDSILGETDEDLRKIIDEDGAAWLLYESIKEKKERPPQGPGFLSNTKNR
jgi:transcriptional regulator with XRE-family HTH domain/predicted RNA-binding Zn-ribbon protein involved in translation (DUF1610 family)